MTKMPPRFSQRTFRDEEGRVWGVHFTTVRTAAYEPVDAPKRGLAAFYCHGLGSPTTEIPLDTPGPEAVETLRAWLSEALNEGE